MILIVQHHADTQCNTGSQHVARQELVSALRQGLAELPVDQRTAVDFHYLQQHSLAETAAAMSKTPGAIRGLLHRAKHSLRGVLGDSSRWFYRR